MGGCSARNCSHHSRNKYRMFKFPADPVRKMKWIINCQRDSWKPGPYAALCSDHFEESQFEQNRQDGWKKLKQTAVPTLFDVSKPGRSILKQVKDFETPEAAGSLMETYLNVAIKKEVDEDDPEPLLTNGPESSASNDLTRLEEDKQIEDSVVHQTTETQNSERTVACSRERKRKRSDSDTIAGDRMASKAYAIQKKSDEYDEFNTYGEYVANEVRRLPPRAQIMVKHHINNILFKAAIGSYDEGLGWTPENAVQSSSHPDSWTPLRPSSSSSSS